MSVKIKSSNKLVPRSKKWTDEEEVYLVEQTSIRHELLFGKMSGTGAEGVKLQKKNAWKSITDGLNALFTNQKRTVETVKKKYYNIKARSTGRVTEMKRPPTGGGPMTKKASKAEETYLDLNEERPNVHGIEGGIDTDDVQLQSDETADEMNTCTAHGDVIQSSNNALEESSSLDETSIDVQRHKNKANKGKGRRLLADLEEENLRLDNLRLNEEIEKIKEEREILKLQKEVLHVKKAKLMFDMGVMPEFIQSEN